MAAAALTVVVVVVLMLVVVTAAALTVMVVVVLMLVVMAAAALTVVVVVVLMLVVMAAAALAVMVVMMVLVLMLVLSVSLGSHCHQLRLEIGLGGHSLQDLLAGQVVPIGGHDGGGGVLLAQQGYGSCHLVLRGGLGAAEQDAAGMADLVVIELAKVLHIQLDLVYVRYGNKAVQLHIQVLGHTFHSTGHVGQLAHAGRLDEDAVRVVLLHHLLQSGAEIAHQRAADAAGVQLIDADAGLLQKAAVNADLAKFVLDQHDLLSGKGLLDQFFDKSGLTGAQKAGENIDLGHVYASFFLLNVPRTSSSGKNDHRGPQFVSPVKLRYLYYSKAVNAKRAFFKK